MAAPERSYEEPRGSMDLMAFYNLQRLYERMAKPGNYAKQLSDTSFSSYRWHKSPEGSLAPLAATAQLEQTSEPLAPLSTAELQSFRLLPAKLTLTDVEKGVLVDTSALGDLNAIGGEREKRPKESKDDDKKQKKQKKDKRDKAEKRKRSEEV